MKFLDFKNMLNMRDCGGFETKNGYVTKYDTLIRSDAPKEMSEEEIEYLLSRNITTEIDLRTLSVIANYPSCLQKLNKFKPLSLGQAARISGVSPADISVLTVYLSMFNKN